jgi:hypothetical protein
MICRKKVLSEYLKQNLSYINAQRFDSKISKAYKFLNVNNFLFA